MGEGEWALGSHPVAKNDAISDVTSKNEKKETLPYLRRERTLLLVANRISQRILGYATSGRAPEDSPSGAPREADYDVNGQGYRRRSSNASSTNWRACSQGDFQQAAKRILQLNLFAGKDKDPDSIWCCGPLLARASPRKRGPSWPNFGERIDATRRIARRR